MSQFAHDPKDLINQGATRAKNIGVALVMICVLLTKYFAVKVVWKRVERVLAIVVVRVAGMLAKVYERVKPHLDHYRQVAMQTRNKAVRVALGLMIAAVTPLESALMKFFGIARTQSERVAVQGTNSVIGMILPVFRAMGAAVSNGMSKPAMQRVIARIMELADEAQKA